MSNITQAEIEQITEYTNGGNSPQCLMTPDLHRLLAASRRAIKLEEALRKIDQKGMTSGRAWITEIARAAPEGT